MAKAKLVERVDKVSQTFNLKEMFDVDFAKLESNEREALQEAIAALVIEKIRDRTASGKWRPGGDPDPGANRYSEAYKKSLAFKAAGKTGKVNMSLTGDMLTTLDVLKSTANTIEIGWDDEVEAAKAYNHNTGDTVPRRPFFGLADSEIKEVRNQFADAVQTAYEKLREDGLSDYAEKILAGIRAARGGRRNEGGDDE